MRIDGPHNIYTPGGERISRRPQGENPVNRPSTVPSSSVGDTAHASMRTRLQSLLPQQAVRDERHLETVRQRLESGYYLTADAAAQTAAAILHEEIGSDGR